MPVTYTNRKGVTYILCRRTTTAGKLRYVFARAPQGPGLDLGDTVDTVPDGFTIRESVNGVVSLVRDVPAVFSAEEVGVVEAAVQRHPKVALYRVAIRGEHLVVYERLGPAANELAAVFSEVGLPLTHVYARIEEHLERSALYEPVLRFHLVDADQRTFGVERRSYSGSAGRPESGDEWLLLGGSGSLNELAHRIVPLLGTNSLFELW